MFTTLTSAMVAMQILLGEVTVSLKAGQVRRQKMKTAAASAAYM